MCVEQGGVRALWSSVAFQDCKAYRLIRRAGIRIDELEGYVRKLHKKLLERCNELTNTVEQILRTSLDLLEELKWSSLMALSDDEQAEALMVLSHGSRGHALLGSTKVDHSILDRSSVASAELKFGVEQKEVMKARAPSVDMLLLTATPIPRTLSLCQRGIYDLSLLLEAPDGREPIQTQVGARYDALACRAPHGHPFTPEGAAERT